MERTSRQAVFGFLWACQSLIHQEFYSNWVKTDNVLGWCTTIFGIALLLRPSSVRLLAALAASSVAYNVGLWPYVKNHILVETLMNMVIFSAIGWSWLQDRRHVALTNYQRSERVFVRFAPILKAMLILMYYFAVLAKLNTDFLNAEFSCVTKMYHEDVLRRLPFLPDGSWVDALSIWATVIIELLIPVFFTFRRTQVWAMAIGLPFHLMLGIIEHRTFSGIAYSLYGLFIIDQLAARVDIWKRAWWDGVSPTRQRAIYRGVSFVVIAFCGGMILAFKTGNYQFSKGMLEPYRLAWMAWGLWMLFILAIYARPMLDRFSGELGTRLPEDLKPRVPAFLWLMIPLVVLNGMCQYLGLKTQTSFTMYSNLRTEGYSNNHLFMPAWRLLGHQDDLVDLVATDHPEIQQYIDHEQRLTYFELRRFASETDDDFTVTYIRNGKRHLFAKKDGQGNDPELVKKHPLLVAKLLFYRPVAKGDHMGCQH